MGAAHSVEAWLFRRRGAAVSPCKCGFGSVIYTAMVDFTDFLLFYAGNYSRKMRSSLSSKSQKGRCHLSFLKTLKEMKKERYKRTYEKEKVDPGQIERKIVKKKRKKHK